MSPLASAARTLSAPAAGDGLPPPRLESAPIATKPAPNTSSASSSTPLISHTQRSTRSTRVIGNAVVREMGKGRLRAALQPAGMIDEGPLEAEFLGEMPGQRADAPRLGGVVAAEQQVHSALLGVEEVVVPRLAGEEGVEPRGGRGGDLVAPTPGDHARPADALRPAGDQLH